MWLRHVRLTPLGAELDTPDLAPTQGWRSTTMHCGTTPSHNSGGERKFPTNFCEGVSTLSPARISPVRPLARAATAPAYAPGFLPALHHVRPQWPSICYALQWLSPRLARIVSQDIPDMHTSGSYLGCTMLCLHMVRGACSCSRVRLLLGASICFPEAGVASVPEARAIRFPEARLAWFNLVRTLTPHLSDRNLSICFATRLIPT
jgi:hypothetical protein